MTLKGVTEAVSLLHTRGFSTELKVCHLNKKAWCGGKELGVAQQCKDLSLNPSVASY